MFLDAAVKPERGGRAIEEQPRFQPEPSNTGDPASAEKCVPASNLPDSENGEKTSPLQRAPPR
jgi:hypothetical protein